MSASADNVENEYEERCNRCSAVNNEEHPLHGFTVALEEVSTEKGWMKLCQRCKVRVMMKERQKQEEHKETGFFSRLLGKLTDN